jgi:hypothetical protein
MTASATDLIEQCMGIVSKRISALEKKRILTDADARSLAEYLKILLMKQKNDQDIEEDIRKILAKAPIEQLQRSCKEAIK